MGGAANDVQRGLTGLSTFGLSEVGNLKTGDKNIDKGTGQVSNASRNAAVLSPTYSLSAAARAGAGAQTLANAPKDAARMAAAAQKTQSDAAAAAERSLALQPKNTPSDNFLATKNRTLQNMRLGLQSSVGGSAGAATPSLSAPSLSGRSKLGS